jgi:hypothetical protein
MNTTPHPSARRHDTAPPPATIVSAIVSLSCGHVERRRYITVEQLFEAEAAGLCSVCAACDVRAYAEHLRTAESRLRRSFTADAPAAEAATTAPPSPALERLAQVVALKSKPGAGALRQRRPVSLSWLEARPAAA